MSAPGNERRNKDGGRNDWQTPPELFGLLNDEFHFNVDGAASDANHLCPTYYTEKLDAFYAEPYGATIFVNPPYSNLKKWIKLFDEWAYQGGCNTVVALVPAAPDTAWWKSAYESAAEVRLLSGRVKFVNPATGLPDGSNTTGSTVFVFKETSKPKLVYLWNWREAL